MKNNSSQPPTAAEIAAYFQGKKATEYQARMIRECGQKVKTYPFERVVTNPYLLACHHRFCPDCQRRRARNWASALRSVIDRESMPTSESDPRRAPHWIAIVLPGVPCDASNLRNQLETLIAYLYLARDQPFWRYTVRTALRLLKVEISRTTDRKLQITPTFTCLVSVSRDLLNAQRQGRLIQRVQRDWIQPENPDSWPGTRSFIIPTATARERDILQNKVSEMIEGHSPQMSRQAFLTINEQLKGVKTVAMYGPEGTPFRPPNVSQADDLRYEQEYSVSRIGEDLPESMSGNRGLELLPWNLKAQLKAR
ncbi:hypothetical protein BKP64_18165 [Marinobacter salinus]|uniref:Replication protein n=1 Tax=Marinobacter salinus TaxID=1874317 RepID=A0A1D9GQW1_9GAMM|nr:hypothetical protein [Marinobacter salinus]AOY89934.1 hypothetical protein BKP64_18165 [Marinobacter salinus]